jgi:hypothetical protein
VSDEYRTVTATFRHLRDKAFFVDRPRAAGQVPIARSLIHAADDAKLDALFDGDEFTFRLRAWKAEELGLA